MTTPLRRDWAWRLHCWLGYRIVEDDEQLRALNACIKGIIQSERQKKRPCKHKSVKKRYGTDEWICAECGMKEGEW
jgi:hypothetical protein